jgi:ABC-type spermidine/putrescine transport system permease subunit II
MSARAGAAAMNDLAPRHPSLLATIFDAGIVRRSVIIAIIVGTILNLIAQGDFLVEGLPLNFWKICLTYCVPYCVSTYGAVTARLETYRKQDEAAKQEQA